MAGDADERIAACCARDSQLFGGLAVLAAAFGFALEKNRDKLTSKRSGVQSEAADAGAATATVGAPAAAAVAPGRLRLDPGVPGETLRLALASGF